MVKYARAMWEGRLCSLALVGLVGALSLGVTPTSAQAIEAVPTALPGVPALEQESNGAIVEANPIMSGQRVRGSLSSASDIDYYRFDASTGDLVFATTMTGPLGSKDGETRLALLGADGVTAIEVDLKNGSFGPSSSSIAGAVIPANGTYFLEVSHPLPDGQLRVYDVYLQLRSNAPVSEVEPNGPSSVMANPLSGGYVSGVYDLADERDLFAMQLNAGDTVFLSLDLDPERDGVGFNARLGFGPLGAGAAGENAIFVVNDPGESESPMPTIPSEAYEVTVLRNGTYHASVTGIDVAQWGDQATYRLSATVLSAARPKCQTYTTVPSSGAIPDNGTVVFPIKVSATGHVDRAAVGLDLTHTQIADLDITLRTPGGYEVPLFTDIAPINAMRMIARFDPFAAVSAPFPLRPVFLQPELGDISWVEGQQAGGTWELVVSDDSPGGTGSVASIDLVLCGPSSLPAQDRAETAPQTAPHLSSLMISPPRFRASSGGASISRNGKEAPIGAVISYTDSQPAHAKLSVFKGVPGRKVRGRCVSLRQSNRDNASCMRHRWRGSFTHRDVAGRNVLRFSGRINGKKLGPGIYKLLVTAVSPDGMSGNRLTGLFTVVPWRR